MNGTGGGAEAEYKRAIEMNPNYASAHQYYGVHFAMLGKLPEAMVQMRRAQQLDPLSLIIDTNVGQLFHMAGDYDQATEQFHKTLEMDPNFFFAHVNFGVLLTNEGLYDQAILQFQTAVKLSANQSDWALGNLAGAYGRAGKKDEAVKTLLELQRLSKRKYVRPLAFGIAYLGLGDTNRALEALDQAVKDRSAGAFFLKTSRLWAPLHSDPRFKKALRSMGLPQ
jgi:tetratricopeptide (TPR) repeat protein